MSEITTISVDKKTAAKLDKICKGLGCSKMEYLERAMDYFMVNGINPLEHESPAKEMQKLIKRVDQVIAFMKVQEKDILRPAMEAIAATDIRIKFQLEKIARKEDTDAIRMRIDKNQTAITNATNLALAASNAQKQGFIHLAKLIDAKEKSGVFKDIAKAYNEIK